MAKSGFKAGGLLFSGLAVAEQVATNFIDPGRPRSRLVRSGQYPTVGADQGARLDIGPGRAMDMSCKRA